MVAYARLTDDFYVAPQIQPDDVAALKELGIRTIMNNRPDGEAFGQPTNAAIAAAAEAAGIDYVYLPVDGRGLTREDVREFARALEQAEGPMLAFCRTGTRCTKVWALARAGKDDADAIIAAGARAGYDLRDLAAFLRNA